MHLIAKAKKYSRGDRGFTIIETLVAVAVLMIAVAGPLVVATKGLRSAQISKNQMVASYLAQETLEVVRNHKDSYIATNGTTGWLDAGIDDIRCNNGSGTCDLVLAPGGGFGQQRCDDSKGCQVYLSQGVRYTTVDSGNDLFTTPFKRHYEIEGDASDAVLHVHVNWYEGSVPYQIHLFTSLSSHIR